jgi:alpha-aminoadipate/glutamate carrier protein LysW
MMTCPECQTELTIPESPAENEIIECDDCRAELEVVALEPVQVALAPEVEEDWGE